MTKLAFFYLFLAFLGSRADLEDDLLEGYRSRIPRKFLEFFRGKSNLKFVASKFTGEDYTYINLTLAMHWLIKLGTVQHIIFQQDIGDLKTQVN